MSEMQTQTLKQQIAHSELVTKEIKEVPADVKLYQSIGRM